MSMTETARETRRTIEAAASEVPAKAAAAREALADLGEKTRDLVLSLQTRARDELSRRRAATADRLENIAGALRSEETPSVERRAFGVAAGPAVALAVVLGTGVAVGLVVSRQMKKKREEKRAAEAEAEALKVEAPPMPQAIEQAPTGVGLSH